MPNTSQTSAAPQMVQVLERWNQWVRVRFAQSGSETWVNLEDTPFAPLEVPEGAGAPVHPGESQMGEPHSGEACHAGPGASEYSDQPFRKK